MERLGKVKRCLMLLSSLSSREEGREVRISSVVHEFLVLRFGVPDGLVAVSELDKLPGQGVLRDTLIRVFGMLLHYRFDFGQWKKGEKLEVALDICVGGTNEELI